MLLGAGASALALALNGLPLRAAAQAVAMAPATSVPPEVAAEIAGARLQGSQLFRYFGFRVYDIGLWVGERAVDDNWADRPLALAISYQRKLGGEQIAERSLEEMQGLADVSAADGQRWLQAMKRLFPDVNSGDRLTGVLLPGQGARFFLNGRLLGDVAEPEFARLFFGIWLASRTSEPAMRDALLGKTR
jgi:hypothetical protein